MSLLNKLKAGKKNVNIIPWPGMDGEKVGIAVLTEDEIQQAVFAAEKHFKDAGLEFSAATVDAYQSEQNTQLLVLALVDPVKKTPIFKSASELRPLLIPGVKDVLVDEVNAWQQECSPRLDGLTEEKYGELFEEVKKNPSILNDSDSRTLRGLITYLASRQSKLPKASGSTS